MAAQDSIKQTLIVSIILCLVCSIAVSAVAVVLKPVQQVNKNLDKQAKILELVDLLDEKQNIQSLFDRYVEAKVVDMKTGKFVDKFNSKTFDQRKMARDPATSTGLSDENDIAGIQRRADYALVYLIRQNGELQYVVLPVHGYGLWSTMYGFIALESDLNTVHGISFYEHAETPGLGGEIDNPAWQELWHGKKVYEAGDYSTPELRVIKGKVDPSTSNPEYKIDGLAGATLTSNGVTNMLQFWFGENGYQSFIKQLKDRG